jgi:hypothetical protein
MNWYRFQACDAHILYGRGTAEEAHRYKETLNAGREQADRYSSMEMTEQEVKALKRASMLNHPQAFILADALKKRSFAGARISKQAGAPAPGRQHAISTTWC